jgi:hypothetical protein
MPVIFSFAPEHALATAGLLAGLAIVLSRGRRAGRPDRFVASAGLSVLAAFLFARSFFDHYLAHLCVPAAMLTGLAVSDLVAKSGRLALRTRMAIAAVVLALLGVSAARVMLQPVRAPWIADIGQAVRSLVPADATLTAFEPAWSTAGGRLPAAGGGVPAFVDPYGAMLSAAVADGSRFTDSASALHSDAAQRAARGALDNSRFVILGPRGLVQLTPDTLDWFRSRFILRYPPVGTEALDLWEKRPLASSGPTTPLSGSGPRPTLLLLTRRTNVVNLNNNVKLFSRGGLWTIRRLSD